MQPQQPQSLPPAGNYDFIINPNKPTKRSLLGGGNSSGPSFALKLLIVLGGLFIIFVILAVVLRSFGVHANFDKTSMLSVAQDQDEILHLTTSGVQNSISSQSKDFVYTVKLSVTSQQTALNNYFKTSNFKPKTKLIALKESASVDATLTNAQAASNYDSVFSSTMKQALDAYRNDLSTAYNKADNKGKSVLKTDYDSVTLLLTQLGSSDN